MEQLKERITDYWSARSESFAQQRLRELASEKRERWLAEFQKYLPQGKPLKILDLGTGTGFFAFLLSTQGHDVTGIDLTEDMIAQAKTTGELLNLPATFLQMDAEAPSFPSESFDALVTRNLTWTLPHMERAYQSWFRLLKSGGVLINFDADYGSDRDAEAELPENHAHKQLAPAMFRENDWITSTVHAYHQPRPQWDVQLLGEIGFDRVSVDFGVWKRIYEEVDEFYNPTPIFTIAAFKK